MKLKFSLRLSIRPRKYLGSGGRCPWIFKPGTRWRSYHHF